MDKYLKLSFSSLVLVCVLMVCYFNTKQKDMIFTEETPMATTEHQELEKQGPTVSKESLTAISVVTTEKANKMSDTVSYQNMSSIRFGNDLKFDVSHCPSGSYMLDRKQDFIPEHQDCPDLFIVGARKGGTTSLIQYLSKHADFKGARMGARAQVGETLYFVSQYNRKTWEQYISMFPRDAAMKGDSSVGNLVHNAAPQRIYSACGGRPKIVMLFRDPIKRLVSNLLMRIRLHTGGRTHLRPMVKPHLEAFLKEIPKDSVNVTNLPNEWSKLVGLFYPAHNMLYEGLYYVHLMNWLCNFPAENILIIRSEEFFNSPSKILDIVVKFLNLKQLDFKTYDKITSVSYNSGKSDVPDYQKLTQSEEVSLRDTFKPFNKVLFEFLHWNTSSSQWSI